MTLWSSGRHTGNGIYPIASVFCNGRGPRTSNCTQHSTGTERNAPLWQVAARRLQTPYAQAERVHVPAKPSQTTRNFDNNNGSTRMSPTNAAKLLRCTRQLQPYLRACHKRNFGTDHAPSSKLHGKIARQLHPCVAPTRNNHSNDRLLLHASLGLSLE